jgi:hypothetical protein
VTAPPSIDWPRLAVGNHRLCCSNCARSDRDRTLGVTIEPGGRGVAHCFRCGYVENWHDERAAPQRPAAAPQRAEQRETLSDHGRALWDACRPLDGDALAYLEARKCAIPPADGDLRWHPALRHPAAGIAGPALVALVTHAETRQPLTLHRTWIRADGTKAAVAPARMLLGGHRKGGGVVRLWPDEAVTTSLGVAEGIETALSLAHAAAPVWAAIDAGNLAALTVLPGIEVLTIAVDHDEAGLQAAEDCAVRWYDAGRDVVLVMHPRAGADLNDMAKEPPQ